MTSDNQAGENPRPDVEKETGTGVGALLRQTREQRGLDLASAARTLRIREAYVKAIEEGHFGDLPGQTYAVGFVRGYAEILGLDGDEIVRRFKQECDAFSGRTELVFPSVVSENSIPGVWIVVVAVVAALALYGIWYVYQSRTPSVAESVPALPDRLASLIHQPVGGGSEVVPVPRHETAAPTPAGATPPPAQPEKTQPSPSSKEDIVPPVEEEQTATGAAQSQGAAPVELAAPVPAAPSQPGEAKPSAGNVPSASQTSTPSVAGAGDQVAAVETGRSSTERKPAPEETEASTTSRVQLRADQDCWVEIRDSQGRVILSRLLRKGDTYAVPDRNGLVLTAGNAGALAILVDGNAVSPLGRMGMVRRDVSLDPERLTAGPGE